jgi:hypothetical protein
MIKNSQKNTFLLFGVLITLIIFIVLLVVFILISKKETENNFLITSEKNISDTVGSVVENTDKNISYQKYNTTNSLNNDENIKNTVTILKSFLIKDVAEIKIPENYIFARGDSTWGETFVFSSKNNIETIDILYKENENMKKTKTEISCEIYTKDRSFDVKISIFGLKWYYIPNNINKNEKYCFASNNFIFTLSRNMDLKDTTISINDIKILSD